MIKSMAETGSYYLEGKGTGRTFLGMDDLIFLPAQIDTFPLGDEMEVQSKVVLGNCPYGIATQDGKLRKRLDVQQAGTRVANFITAATEELKSIARICGKSTVADLSRDDLVSLDPELSRI